MGSGRAGGREPAAEARTGGEGSAPTATDAGELHPAIVKLGPERRSAQSPDDAELWVL